MRNRRKYWLLILSLSILLTGMWYISPARKNSLIPVVKLLETNTSNLNVSIYFKGTIVNQNTKNIYFTESARVKKIYVEIGDEVKVGDIIMTAVPDSDITGQINQFDENIISVFNDLMGSSWNTADSVYCSAENGIITVRSPIDGLISELPAKSGVITSAAGLCVSVSDPSDLCIKASIPEAYVQDIKSGMECIITGTAFRNKSYMGMVELIMPYATTSQTLSGSGETVVEALISIENPDNALRAGYNARVELYIEKHENAISIPYEAINQDNHQQYVYVYNRGTLEKRFIETGIELENLTEVISGLSKGDYIVVGTDKILSDGIAVKAVLG